ncbi:hypothetical protein DFH06DRAFT_1338440 [Mycena polygramma]|nr:hypothetical protein DFH06DRAFT_1338440 [Mycena polygramma]
MLKEAGDHFRNRSNADRWFKTKEVKDDIGGSWDKFDYVMVGGEKYTLMEDFLARLKDAVSAANANKATRRPLAVRLPPKNQRSGHCKPSQTCDLIW